MDTATLKSLLAPVFETVADRPLDAELEARLEREIPAAGTRCAAIEKACHEAIADGWMCSQGGAGRRFGRVIEATPETGNLSVDVVDLENIVGPHHRHPRGEVCLVMPVTKGARFDGRGRGWCVYPWGSEHRPTVTDGEALVLYLLPGGEIEFTGQ